MAVEFGVQPIVDAGSPLSDDQFKRLIATEIQNAMAYIDSSETISFDRYRNAEYYRGVMEDVPALKGQSSVTSSEVSDYISMMLPSLLRPFTSGDKLWNYSTPQGLSDQIAKQITQFINEIVFRKDNRGEIILNNWAYDGLVQKTGIVKAWWEDDVEVKDISYGGLNDAEYADIAQKIAQDNTYEIQGYQRAPNPNGGFTHDIALRRSTPAGKVCIYVIPPDEFVISRDARNKDDAILQSHRTWIVAGDLIEQGYPADVVNRLPTFIDYRAQLTRPGSSGREFNRQNMADPSLRKVTIYEGIIRCNKDGTGVRPWYFKAGGQDGGVYILESAPYDAQIFFCEFSPEPIPHQFVGTCPADRLAQIQKVNTVLLRGLLNGLYLSLAPQREVVADNILSPDQLSNYAPGANILVTSQGSVTNIPLPFTTEYALGAIQYFDGKAADRSGVSRQSAGLDPDALQNQSATAANLAWNASMGRMEMTARIWAYTGMRQLGEAILKLLITYQDYARNVTMGGVPQTVDPRQWQQYIDMEVSVSTGLGTGHRDRDMAALMNILKMQVTWLQQFGPTPVCSWQDVVNTQQRIAEASGISDPNAYFHTPPEGWQPQPPPPQPTPDAVLNAKTKQMDIQTRASLDLREQNLQAMLDMIQAQIDELAIRVKGDKEAPNVHRLKTNIPSPFPGTGR